MCRHFPSQAFFAAGHLVLPLIIEVFPVMRCEQLSGPPRSLGAGIYVDGFLEPLPGPGMSLR